MWSRNYMSCIIEVVMYDNIMWIAATFWKFWFIYKMYLRDTLWKTLQTYSFIFFINAQVKIWNSQMNILVVKFKNFLILLRLLKTFIFNIFYYLICLDVRSCKPWKKNCPTSDYYNFSRTFIIYCCLLLILYVNTEFKILMTLKVPQKLLWRDTYELL